MSIILVALVASTLGAAPAPYTASTATGLKDPAVERRLFDAVMRLASTSPRLTEAEQECAKATAADKLLQAAADALRGDLSGPLAGYSEARKFFWNSQDDWCNKQGGDYGAREIALRLIGARSFLKPWLQERLEEAQAAQARPLTSVEVAALVAAGLLALPVLAPL